MRMVDVAQKGQLSNADGQLNNPFGICKLRDGRWAVADYYNKRVCILQPHGGWQRNCLQHSTGVTVCVRCVMCHAKSQLGMTMERL